MNFGWKFNPRSPKFHVFWTPATRVFWGFMFWAPKFALPFISIIGGNWMKFSSNFVTIWTLPNQISCIKKWLSRLRSNCRNLHVAFQKNQKPSLLIKENSRSGPGNLDYNISNKPSPDFGFSLHASVGKNSRSLGAAERNIFIAVRQIRRGKHHSPTRRRIVMKRHGIVSQCVPAPLN